MEGDKEIIDEFLTTIRGDIISNADTQDRNATGKAKASLRIETLDSGGKLIDGAGYVEWGWEYGRAPGRMPPRSAIEQWIEAKGIIPTGTTVKGLAFLIARKIAREGTSLFREGAPSGVVTGAITAERLDSLRGAFGKQYKTMVRTEIIKAFRS